MGAYDGNAGDMPIFNMDPAIQMQLANMALALSRTLMNGPLWVVTKTSMTSPDGDSRTELEPMGFRLIALEGLLDGFYIVAEEPIGWNRRCSFTPGGAINVEFFDNTNQLRVMQLVSFEMKGWKTVLQVVDNLGS